MNKSLEYYHRQLTSVEILLSAFYDDCFIIKDENLP